MKIKAVLAAALLAFAALPISYADAQVRVRGYYRSDGTYVRPHIRSSPNGTTADNYGPSRSSPDYSDSLSDLSTVSPYTRDADRDGIANMYDFDDDGDGVSDDADRSQYGGLTSRPAPVRTPYGYKLPD
jgi:hypothetical protein